MCVILVDALAYMLRWGKWRGADAVVIHLVRRGQNDVDVCVSLFQDGEMLEGDLT
jgi:hypothetical protein